MRVGDLHFLGPADLDNRRLPGSRVHPSSLGTDDAELRRGRGCTPDPIDVRAVLDAALASRRCTQAELARQTWEQRGLRGLRRVAELVRWPTGSRSHRWSRASGGGS